MLNSRAASKILRILLSSSLNKGSLGTDVSPAASFSIPAFAKISFNNSGSFNNSLVISALSSCFKESFLAFSSA